MLILNEAEALLLSFIVRVLLVKAAPYRSVFYYPLLFNTHHHMACKTYIDVLVRLDAFAGVTSPVFHCFSDV